MDINQAKSYITPFLLSPLLTERSTLYCLEPMGMGTPFIESLSSYLTRLAKAHNVKVNTLVYMQIKDFFQKEHLKDSKNFGGISKYINSNGNTTKNIVDAIKVATRREDLSKLTLLSFSEIFRTKPIKEKKSWCPKCLKNFKASSTIYEPLIWYIRFIEYCPIHKMKLLETCTVCGKKQPFLTSSVLTGHCFYCKSFLGESTLSKSIVSKDLNSSELSWNNWLIKNFSSLLVIGQIENSLPSYKLRYLLELFSLKYENQLADLFGISRVTVYQWFANQKKPTIFILLAMLYVIDIDIVNFLYGQIPIKKITILKNRMQFIRENIIRTIKIESINVVDLKLRLEEALKMDIPISLTDFRKKYNYNESLIRKYYPELCKQISKRYMLYRKKEKNIK